MNSYHLPRRRASCRRLLMLMLLLMPLATAGPALAVRDTMPGWSSQRLAILLSGHTARRAPRAGSPQAARVAARRPITGERTALPVFGAAKGPRGTRWLHVLLPGRPNGSTGWIEQAGTLEAKTTWHILVSLDARLVRAYSRGRLVRTFGAVVGKPSTPTPSGRFFVEETVQMPAGDAGGPFALALSARSNVLQEFEGGPGQIAIHGRDNLVGAIGTGSSHGCVRLQTPSISWLAARIGPGTPVTIEQG